MAGRAAEIAALHQALAQAGAAEGGLILITGEAGIGKTSLVRAALREPPVACSVLWGTCRDDPGVPGLWPWVEVLRAAAETGLLQAAEAIEIEGLIGVPAGPGIEAAGTVAPGGQELRRFHMFDTVARALRRAASAQAARRRPRRRALGGRGHPSAAAVPAAGPAPLPDARRRRLPAGRGRR